MWPVFESAIAPLGLVKKGWNTMGKKIEPLKQAVNAAA